MFTVGQLVESLGHDDVDVRWSDIPLRFPVQSFTCPSTRPLKDPSHEHDRAHHHAPV